MCISDSFVVDSNNYSRSCFANQGEICLATSRLYVHKDIFERFVDEFVSKTKQLKVSDPKEQDADLGALISETHHRKVTSYLDLAKTEVGVNILCGGALQLGGKNQKVDVSLAKISKEL